VVGCQTKYQECATDSPHNCKTKVLTMSSSRVVGDVLPADGVCVARKLCPCTRSRQTNALGSVRALPNGSPTLFNEGKGFNKGPTAPKNAHLKADALSPNLQRTPSEKGHPLGNLVKADDPRRAGRAGVGPAQCKAALAWRPLGTQALTPVGTASVLRAMDAVPTGVNA